MKYIVNIGGVEVPVLADSAGKAVYEAIALKGLEGWTGEASVTWDGGTSKFRVSDVGVVSGHAKASGMTDLRDMFKGWRLP